MEIHVRGHYDQMARVNNFLGILMRPRDGDEVYDVAAGNSLYAR